MSDAAEAGLRLTTLGTGSAFAGIGHNAAACVDGRLLLDCGAPVLTLMPAVGLDPGRVETVLLSHFHADHSFQLPLLVGARRLTPDASPPLTVVGPLGTADFLERLLVLGFGERLAELARAPEGLRILEWSGGEQAELGGYRVEAVAMVHASDIRALGYRVERNGVSLGYSGDTAWCEGILALARRSDYLLCECTSMDRPEPTHLCRAEVLRLIREAPDARLILTHLSQRRPVPGAILAADGVTLPLRRPGSPAAQPASGSRQAADAEGQ
ncbi:MAG TPA: ribonuclease Z [Verrucomicrobiae bacterium]|nr:ribonuclease Z [Verrucomicrobiae bacterium]